MYRDQENHTFYQDVSHALVPYEPPVSDKSRVQKRHPFLRGQTYGGYGQYGNPFALMPSAGG